MTLIVLIGITLLCSLGRWQLLRGQEKQSILTQWETHSHRPAIDETALTLTNPPARYAAIKLTGHFLNNYTVLLDNKTNNGRPGYHILTPLELQNQTVILIDRGWVPMQRNRKDLPRIPVIMGKVTIEGYLDFAYRNPFIHEAIENNEIKWPLRVQQLDWDQIGLLLNKSIFPMLVKFNHPNAYSFELASVKGEWMSAERHYGYAIQWFLLAFTLGALYSLFCFRHCRQGKV